MVAAHQVSNAPRNDAVSALQPSMEPAATRFYLSIAARTDIGKVRAKNEDAFIVADLSRRHALGEILPARFEVGQEGVLLAVSDGMGGAQAGEVASALVIETLTRALTTPAPNTPRDTPRDTLLNDVIQQAHRAVWDVAQRQLKKMGATLTAVLVDAGQAYIAEVGDSRAYLVRAGELRQLTHDQSMVQVLVDTGVLAPEEVEDSPLKNVILQALGNQPTVKVALARLELRHNDCLVLCSDGLSSLVPDDEIRDIVLKSGRPEVAVQALVNLANARGGTDNITVIVAGIGGNLTVSAANESITDTFEVVTPFDLPGTGKKA
jgi:PPM family protein phosphatase